LKPWSIIANTFTWSLYEALTCNSFAIVVSFTHTLEFDKDGNDDDDDDYDDGII